MLHYLSLYRKLPKDILFIVAAEIFVQMLNAAFMAILLIYMEKQGFQDHESASYVGYRFLGVLLFAFPLGVYIKKRRIKPFFLLSAILTPLFTLLIIYSIDFNLRFLLIPSMFLWGISFMIFQVSVVPYILRNVELELQSEAISLSYSTFAIGNILSGFFIYAYAKIFPTLFSEKWALIGTAFLAMLGFVLLLFNSNTEQIPAHEQKPKPIFDYDWKIIAKALFPHFVIAVGAGLSIPFVGLFLYKIHGIDSDTFSIISACTTILVLFTVLLVPGVRKTFGFKVAITLTQTIAVLALVVMAFTEQYQMLWWAAPMAVISFVIRQPLMNMAGPITTELVMNYVGERNREMISALSAAIWSGSWFFSSKIFQGLRISDVKYSNIFFITAALYFFGVILYFILILENEKRSTSEEI